MKDLNLPQLTELSTEGFIKVIDKASGNMFNALLPASSLYGSFTGTLTGCSTSPTETFNYSVFGKTVTVSLEVDLLATSNANTCTVTGFPSAIRPATASFTTFILTQDNGGTPLVSRGRVETDGTLTLTDGIRLNFPASATDFTTSGQKGLVACSFSYTLQ